VTKDPDNIPRRFSRKLRRNPYLLKKSTLQETNSREEYDYVAVEMNVEECPG
jgi:hypothetical protein